MQMTTSQEFAKELDVQDPLAKYRSQFFMPPGKTRAEQLYFTGNSLGLQPKSVKDYIQQELDDWQKLGVEGHFHGKNPWFSYHHFFDKEAKVVGANPEEVVVMNNLTVNLHLLLASFYRPTVSRYKIIMEGGAFPSDMYVIESQVKHHGYAYADAVVEINP
jgi:kynureninase